MVWIKKHPVLFLVLFGLLIRFVFYPFSDVVDADSVSRAFMAEWWLDNPKWISHGVWAPFHFYFSALGIFLFGDRATGPIILHIIIAALSVVPLYKFSARVFSERGAFFSALAYTLFPLVLRNSFHALAGVPYLFFVFWAMYYSSKAIDTNRLKHAIFAGTAMTIACGFRYEAWLIAAIFTLVIALFKKFKMALFFGFFSSLFPMVWMMGNYLKFGEFLYSVKGAYVWNILKLGVNDQVNGTELFQRALFFPYSLFLLLGLPLFIILCFGTYRLIRNKLITRKHLIWLLPYFIVLVVYIFKAMGGTLLQQHRFTITLFALLVPFFSLIYSYFSPRIKLLFIVLVVLNVPLSFYSYKIPFHRPFGGSLGAALYNISTFTGKEIEAISQQEKERTHLIANEISTHLQPNEAILIDFMSWSETYYLGLHSNTKNIFYFPGAAHSQIKKDDLIKILVTRGKRNGLFILDKNSRFYQEVTFNENELCFQTKDTEFYFTVKKIKEIDGVEIYRYIYTNC